jgi:hypothetical protein
MDELIFVLLSCEKISAHVYRRATDLPSSNDLRNDTVVSHSFKNAGEKKKGSAENFGKYGCLQEISLLRKQN